MHISAHFSQERSPAAQSCHGAGHIGRSAAGILLKQPCPRGRSPTLGKIDKSFSQGDDVKGLLHSVPSPPKFSALIIPRCPFLFN